MGFNDYGILRYVVVVLILVCGRVDALRRASTLNLASMRIYTAELQLKESGRAATVLGDHCRAELEAVQEGLQRSSQRVLIDPEDARRELVRVDDFLQSCGQNLSSVVNSQAYDLLTRVEQSVASAENLIDQSDITEITPPSQAIILR